MIGKQKFLAQITAGEAPQRSDTAQLDGVHRMGITDCLPANCRDAKIFASTAGCECRVVAIRLEPHPAGDAKIFASLQIAEIQYIIA